MLGPIAEQRFVAGAGWDLPELADLRKGHETCSLHHQNQRVATVSCRAIGVGRIARVSLSSRMDHTARHRHRTSQASSGSPADRGILDRGDRVTPLQAVPETSRRKRAKAQPRPRILVIEDDPYAREALTLLLDFYGYEVVSASNGTDGLDLLTEATPDLVVTDWRMPGLSGLALCRALRERHDTIPIIVVTSADEVFSHDQPVNARLRKPIDPPLLNHVITRELRALRRR